MKFVSAAFHPLLMPTYTGLLVYWVAPSIFSPVPNDYIPHFIGIIFLTTCIIPGGSILFLKITKTVSNLDLTNRKERVLPFLFVSCFYGVSTYMFHYKLNTSSMITAIMIITTILIVILSLISLKFKISIHSSAIWGVCGIVSALAFQYQGFSQIIVIAIPFVAAGLTSSSRLYLGRHSPDQVWKGATLGFFFCFIGTYFFA